MVLSACGEPRGWPTFAFFIDRWPIQAVLWLEWGTVFAVSIPLRFANQQVHMLRHDYISVNETVPHVLQG